MSHSFSSFSKLQNPPPLMAQPVPFKVTPSMSERQLGISSGDLGIFMENHSLENQTRSLTERVLLQNHHSNHHCLIARLIVRKMEMDQSPSLTFIYKQYLKTEALLSCWGGVYRTLIPSTFYPMLFSTYHLSPFSFSSLFSPFPFNFSFCSLMINFSFSFFVRPAPTLSI